MRPQTNRLKLFVFFTCAFGVMAQAASENNLVLPKPARLVSDTSSVLRPEERETLERRLQALRDSGLAEAVVYIAPSLPENMVMEDLTLRSANAWGVGDERADNGIVIFAFMKDRKVRIEVGSGLEARISDAAASAIIEKRIAPAFRAGKYLDGLTAAIREIEALLRQNGAASVTTVLGPTRRIAGPGNAPKLLRRVNPHYPDDARRAGTQGQVHLELLIDRAGHVRTVTVRKGLPNGLSEAATAAARQWIFEQVLADGEATPALIDIVIDFRL